MNLNEFRQRIEANQPSTEDGIEWVVALTVAEAQWLLEGIEKDREALEDFEYIAAIGSCPWCSCPIGHYDASYIIGHYATCPRQLALAHWEDEP